MTLEEKVAQMVQVPVIMVSHEEALMWARRGAGSFLHTIGDEAREIQEAALSSRLGIPVLFGIDAIHGHGINPKAAIFPSQLATSCSWNPEVARKMGRVTAREVSADGLHWTFSPVLCLGRDTRWGRVDETFGEDPYLAGEMGAAIIRGYQGEDLKAEDAILACAKHYIAYGEATGGRDAYDSSITWRRLRETFLPPFRKAVEAGCATFMTAYGSIDGTPFTISQKAMKQILREELGFDGMVVTDWDNCMNLKTRQHVCETIQEAARLSAQAGNDMIMTTTDFYEAALEEIRAGRLEESVIDEAVRNILNAKDRLGLLENPHKRGNAAWIGCEEHRAEALAAARESVTLLRNNGILPLSEKRARKVAIIGANADDVVAQYGDWAYFTHPSPKLDYPPVRPYVTLKEGIAAQCEKRGMEWVYAWGCGPIPSEKDDLAAAVKAAEGADVIVLAVGDRPEQHGETHDRADLNLTGRQDELFEALKALNIPIVTVFIAGKPLCANREAEDSAAFVCAFNGGQFGGQALAEALFGELNPKGRLSITFPRHSGQMPVHYASFSGWHGGRYVDQPEAPLFAFGEGLGYTSFEYSDLTFDTDTFTVRFTLKNVGDRAGCETAQIYFRDCFSSVMEPMKRLCGFVQTELLPGESKEIAVTLPKDSFALVTADEQTLTEPGGFVLMVGHSSKDEDMISCEFVL